MATGLIALLDDIAVMAKVAAASLDDTAAAASKAAAKAAGVVIDDAAVTPRYVTGFSAARELPIVGKIAWGSLRNKMLFLLPGALLLSECAPWAIMPLLMAGGVYLCFEGAEKLREMVFKHEAHTAGDVSSAISAAELERTTVTGAIRTDLILSGEIMAITLAAVAELSFVPRAAVLAIVGLVITAGVYGLVALIVKADDVGLMMSRSRLRLVSGTGRGLVVGMPALLQCLSIIGTLAMLWVGGGIILHGLETYGIRAPMALLHAWSHSAKPIAGPAGAWLVEAAGAGLAGAIIGAVVVALLAPFHK